MNTIQKNIAAGFGLVGITLVCLGADQEKSVQAARVPEGIQLIAAMSETNYTSGDRILLSLITTNGSSQPLTVSFSSDPTLEYNVRITGLSDKQEAPLTRFGSRFQRGFFVTTKGKTLEPGQSSTNTIVLSQVYDLTSPQTYEVNVHNLHLEAKPIQFHVQAF
ncbi:MAG TPA: hypothetical protein VFW05_09120 [Verrucomicrobiae bacterium]|nr:hypothetical protein [Verrucomicrobiae bacterium]